MSTRESLNIVFTGKEQLELRTEAVPELGPGQLLIESKATLISTGTECICYQRNFEPGTHWHGWVKYPFYPGYSNAGTVLAVGEGVTDFVAGDRVATRSNHRQYVVANATGALKIPDGVSDEDATWFGLAKIVQNGVRRAEHVMGDVVVVVGLGLLGQLVTQYTRLMGAREVIAVDLSGARLEMAMAHGATHMIQAGAGDAVETVREITDGHMADVVYDVTGFPAVFAQALKHTRRFGRFVLLGDTGVPSGQSLTADIITKGLRIVGAHDSNPPAESTDHNYWSSDKIAELFYTYVERGQMNVSNLVTHRYSPRDAAETYNMLVTDRSAVMGVIFDWTQL
ncbi:MAG: zinc-binding dehydrogenase [Chloroflexota bacterium]